MQKLHLVTSKEHTTVTIHLFFYEDPYPFVLLKAGNHKSHGVRKLDCKVKKWDYFPGDSDSVH